MLRAAFVPLCLLMFTISKPACLPAGINGNGCNPLIKSTYLATLPCKAGGRQAWNGLNNTCIPASIYGYTVDCFSRQVRYSVFDICSRLFIFRSVAMSLCSIFCDSGQKLVTGVIFATIITRHCWLKPRILVNSLLKSLKK